MISFDGRERSGGSVGLCLRGLQAGAFVLFMKKYYHLHEEYLASLKKQSVMKITQALLDSLTEQA